MSAKTRRKARRRREALARNEGHEGCQSCEVCLLPHCPDCHPDRRTCPMDHTGNRDHLEGSVTQRLQPYRDWLNGWTATRAELNRLRALGAPDDITAKRLRQAAQLETFGVNDTLFEVMCRIAATGRITQMDLDMLHREGIGR
ncbi:hypothetical protein [Pseudactinotalea sp. Z1732]|uniref:hypothetical protein n=1 Tax=Micrococcales TaxID=85006 RepID=UPI003C7ED45C